MKSLAFVSIVVMVLYVQCVQGESEVLMDKELKGQLERNVQVWDRWIENGLSEETILTVNFHFYATSKESAAALENAFEEAELEYRTTVTTTLLVLKGWEIEVDVTRAWSLEILQEVTEAMYQLSRDSNSSLEGLGALVDRNT